jgi:maltose alpha-D-glucosyltransferase/alpha-amylase
MIGAQSESRTQNGRIRGVPTAAFSDVRGEGPPGPIRRGSVEQSNTTLVFGERLLVKLFRRLTPGVNPDFEIGRFLTEKTDFTRVPKTAGSLEYRKTRGEPASLAIAQSLVPNQGQGWEWALGVLSRYYDQVAALRDGPVGLGPAVPRVYDLSETEPPEAVREAVGPALRSAAVLGQRTGELHLALASDHDDPAFAPEPLGPADLDAVAERLRAGAPAVFRALNDRAEDLSGGVKHLIDLVLSAGPALVARTSTKPPWAPGMQKIRCHGDYHLGQVLWTESDFVILDFEGEPGRPAAERRAKQSVLKDLAGMLRSFDYAASSALLILGHRGPSEAERLEPWGAIWRDWVSASFLRAYRKTVESTELLPPPAVASRLLDFFVLDKLVFEMQYELNYRPDWLRIPLFAIARLVDESAESRPVL